MRNQSPKRISTLLLVLFLLPVSVRAELSQKQARKLISQAAGMSLPTSAVRIERISASSESASEISAELKLVFRLSRDRGGDWRIREVRAAEARWDIVESAAQTSKVDGQPNNCSPPDEFGRVKPQTALSVKLARCLVANLFTISLPSDTVRIKEISGLGLGPQPSAVAVSLVRLDFRVVREAGGWRVSEFHAGKGSWASIDTFPGAPESVKRGKTTEELNLIATALESFRRARGSFVISDKHAVLIDNLTPHYLHRIMRLDAWQRPYRYQGDREHFTLRSVGPDGKENTADDIVIVK